MIIDKYDIFKVEKEWEILCDKCVYICNQWKLTAICMDDSIVYRIRVEYAAGVSFVTKLIFN